MTRIPSPPPLVQARDLASAYLFLCTRHGTPDRRPGRVRHHAHE